jgi:putative membrane protein
MADAALSLPVVRGISGWILRAPVCGGIFVLVVTGLHMPRPFEWGLESPGGSALEHVALLVASLLFWWPLANPSRLRPPGSFAGRMVYLFCVEVALTALFTYLLMADHAVYPSYQFAPRLIPGLSATDDQVLGGILLSAVSSLVLLGALGLSFRRWAHADKHRG